MTCVIQKMDSISLPGKTWFFRIFFLLFTMSIVIAAHAQTARVSKLPGEAQLYLPMLKEEIDKAWPDIPIREFHAGLIDQESGWKTKAVLKTDREYGCGLGQMTMTYKADGSVRFDTISDMKKVDKELAGWNWRDCANVHYQLRAIVVKTKMDAKTCFSSMANFEEAMACTAAKYNGGGGSITTRVRLCRVDGDCDPTKWFDNLQNQCGMSKVKAKGYGESFCEINSKYPGRIWARMPKFKGLLDD